MMHRKYIYIIGLLTLFSLFLILIFFAGNKREPQTTQDISTALPQQAAYISGSGVVEPISGNIAICPPLNRIVEKIDVSINQRIKKGSILFQLYNKDLIANLKIKQKKYEESLAYLSKLEALPQKEDLIIAEESLNKIELALNQSQLEYCLTKKHARTQEEKCIGLYKYQQAESDLRASQAQLAKVQSGTWPPDLKIARIEMEQAKADVEAMETEIEQTYIKSPIDGTVLQVNIHEGETLTLSKAAMILGNVDEFNLKVSIDQFNAPKFHSSYRAEAFKRGDIKTKIPLKFIHIEPVMVPKKYLTNELHEKVDTQVVEILYRIEKHPPHLLVGEQMDVYIYTSESSPQ